VCVGGAGGWGEQASSIPKGGTAGTWTYPSPQMFYNALVRKDKAHDVTPHDMESVVSVHNGVRCRLAVPLSHPSSRQQPSTQWAAGGWSN
jgi:hypothetical protein